MAADDKIRPRRRGAYAPRVALVGRTTEQVANRFRALAYDVDLSTSEFLDLLIREAISDPGLVARCLEARELPDHVQRDRQGVAFQSDHNAKANELESSGEGLNELVIPLPWFSDLNDR